MSQRVIQNTIIKLTRPDGKKLIFGENQRFEIYRLTGLGVGEIEKDTTGNALMDGEMWLGSRVLNRILEIESEWYTADARSYFTDFFQHNIRFEAEIIFNGSSYYGSCVLDEAYDCEQHGGSLYSGSGIEVGLYFSDPHLYTNTVYRYQIGKETTYNFLFYTQPEQHSLAVPSGAGLIHYFSLFREAQEYTINNPSSTPNGIEAFIKAEGEVINPRITNLTTGMHLQFNLVLAPGDELYINTQRGFIQATKNGADIMRYLTLPSRMLQVKSGENKLVFNPDAGANKAGCEISFRGKVLAI